MALKLKYNFIQGVNSIVFFRFLCVSINFISIIILANRIPQSEIGIFTMWVVNSNLLVLVFSLGEINRAIKYLPQIRDSHNVHVFVMSNIRKISLVVISACVILKGFLYLINISFNLFWIVTILFISMLFCRYFSEIFKALEHPMLSLLINPFIPYAFFFLSIFLLPLNGTNCILYLGIGFIFGIVISIILYYRIIGIQDMGKPENHFKSHKYLASENVFFIIISLLIMFISRASVPILQFYNKYDYLAFLGITLKVLVPFEVAYSAAVAEYVPKIIRLKSIDAKSSRNPWMSEIYSANRILRRYAILFFIGSIIGAFVIKYFLPQDYTNISYYIIIIAFSKFVGLNLGVYQSLIIYLGSLLKITMYTLSAVIISIIFIVLSVKMDNLTMIHVSIGFGLIFYQIILSIIGKRHFRQYIMVKS